MEGTRRHGIRHLQPPVRLSVELGRSSCENQLRHTGDPVGLGRGLTVLREAGADAVASLQELSEQWSDLVRRRAA